MAPCFGDRREAGRALAKRLTVYAGRDDVVVLGLARGGVPVAHEVARALGAALDVLVVRKLGVPWQPELALGAIAAGVRVLDEEVLSQVHLAPELVEEISCSAEAEVREREAIYRPRAPRIALRDRIALLVDDGLATGSTMLAAVAAARGAGAARVVVAVPVAPVATCRRMRGEADEVVCAVTPEPFHAVGLWYGDFSATTDDEVCELLRAGEPGPAAKT